MKKAAIVLLVSFVVFSSCSRKTKDEPFHFYVTTDIHMTKQRPDYTSLCFKNDILADIKKDSAGLGKFIVVTGDMDPFFRTRKSVESVLGKVFRFYPVLGNHDVGFTNNRYELYPDSNWANVFDIVKYNRLHLKNIAEWGPSYRTPALDSVVYIDSVGNKFISTYDSLDVIGSKYTTYSFDESNSHFVILDIYSGLRCFGGRHNGRVSKELFNWLANDLNKTDKKNIFIFAHQPMKNSTGEDKWHVLVNEAYEILCRDSARSFGADSLKWFAKEYTQKIASRDEFWDLLKKHKVVAYFCGHTHHYSVKKYDGVWEVNLQYGAWNVPDSTRYAKIFVNGNDVDMQVLTYKNDPSHFNLAETVKLK